MSFSEARANLSRALDSVVDDAEVLAITRRGKETVAVVPLAEWQSLKETEYLLRSPANRKHLMRSIAELEQGKGVVRDLISADLAPHQQSA
ncbi:MAG: type II toxin-antitoxin system prevent-host-death family antitoxin [Promicromonosporaceae bacterium]|nr:type II toxin-antitoxin system prevent-host-death family antitoxin [Promicromonosporaceae bacterium]